MYLFAESSVVPDITLLNIGDSIAHGMGVVPGATPNRYINLLHAYLAQHQPVELIDLSENGCTTRRALEKTRDCFEFGKLRSAAENSKVIAYISLGNVDAKLVPNAERVICGLRPFRLLPQRYQGARLDPRPYFSNTSGRRQLQMIESFLRCSMRAALMKWLGAKTILPLEESAQNMRDILKLLMAEAPNLEVHLIGTYPILHWGFGKSATSFREFDAALKKLVATVDCQASFIEIHTLLSTEGGGAFLCADRFHPNDEGHKRIFAALASKTSNRTQSGSQTSNFLKSS